MILNLTYTLNLLKDSSHTQKRVAIVGSGPSGLMAATQLAGKLPGKLLIDLYEKRPAYGRKLLIAGSSGLNISHHCSIKDFAAHYQGFTPELWEKWLAQYSPHDWIQFIESLGLETFLGTSSRYFVKEMKASQLLRLWLDYLQKNKVRLIPNFLWTPCADLLQVNGQHYDAVILALGGGSWEDQEPAWLNQLNALGIKTNSFYPTNVGYSVSWKPEFLKEAEGKPLKNIILKTKKGEKRGELVITQYGLEGTPIYFFGVPGLASLDLLPDLSKEEVLNKLQKSKENTLPIRRAKKLLPLSEAALALLFHHIEESARSSIESLTEKIKAFPLQLESPRPLQEAISSGGGIALHEVSTQTQQEFMLKKHPGVYCTGEMLDWVAPTGGFLIQACVTQGAMVGRNILNYLIALDK